MDLVIQCRVRGIVGAQRQTTNLQILKHLAPRITGRVGGTAAKPKGFYDLLRAGNARAALWISSGRRRIAGFTSWGNEAPEGEPEPDHYQMVLT